MLFRSKGIYLNSIDYIKEFHLIKLSTAYYIGAKNCLTILIFIWLEAYNIKRLVQLYSIKKYKKDKDLPIIIIFNNFICTMCSIAIKNK